MRTLMLLVCLLPRLVHGAQDVYAYRNAAAGDDEEMVRVRNAAKMQRIDPGIWTVADATTYRTITWTATQIVTVNAVLAGIMGSTDWMRPGMSAILAPVAWPWIDTSLGGAARSQAMRYLLRAVVNQLMHSTGETGIAPTSLQILWPVDIGIPVSALTQMGCTLGGMATQDGASVLQETLCPLAALDAALTAAGVP